MKEKSILFDIGNKIKKISDQRIEKNEYSNIIKKHLHKDKLISDV